VAERKARKRIGFDKFRKRCTFAKKYDILKIEVCDKTEDIKGNMEGSTEGKSSMSEMNREELEKQFEEKSKILDLMIQCLPQMEAKDRKLAEATDEETRQKLQAEIAKFQEEYTELLAECQELDAQLTKLEEE